jgi:large subunit ribosomal protein L29
MKTKTKELKDKNLRDKTIEELNKDLRTVLQDQFQWRMRKGASENPPSHEPRKMRRKIARIKTIIREKQ